MNFAELVTTDRRLVILLLLTEVPDYTLNEYVLRQGMAEFKGHKVSRDVLRTDLAWLQEQGLVQVQDVLGTKKAKLTSRGADVASGAATNPGVKRPEA